MSAADTSYMKEKPVLSLLLSMGIPMMLSMLINSLYNIVDGIFVARMSEDAMMAISLVYPVQNLLHSIAVGFGVGTNAVIAIFLGSRKGDAASSAASQGILLNLCHGLLFMVFGILFMQPFLNMFTSNETVLAYGMQYGIIVLCFSMIHTTELSFEKIFQSMGRMKTSMISLGSSCMINIILDPLLIFGIGPFPEMGIRGAALATGIGQTTGLCIYLLTSRQNPDSQKQFPGGWKRRADSDQPVPAIAFVDFRIWNNVNVYLRSQCDEPFCQRRFAPEMPPLQTASPDYDFGHVGEPRIFRNLRRYIFSVCCDDFCTKLLRQTHIRLQSNGIFRVHISVSGCLHIECGKASAKCLRHFFCHSYNAFIGWRRGQTHQNMLF